MRELLRHRHCAHAGRRLYKGLHIYHEHPREEDGGVVCQERLGRLGVDPMRDSGRLRYAHGAALDAAAGKFDAVLDWQSSWSHQGMLPNCDATSPRGPRRRAPWAPGCKRRGHGCR